KGSSPNRGERFGREAPVPSLRSDLKGPAVTGRPLRSMSPGLRLRRRPPPLLTRKSLPATTGLGLRTGSGASSALQDPARLQPSRGPSVTERCRAELARLRHLPTTAYSEAVGGGAL